jgi:trehalose 6-phosphate phosphatase
MRPISMTTGSLRHHPPLLQPHGDALFLDLDGTLLEIADHPNAVSASVELLSLLRELSIQLDGACAVITGRTVADADEILKGALGTIAGVHGAEFKTPVASTVQWSNDNGPVWAARADAYALASRLQLLIEDKRASLALHYRHSPELAAEVHAGAEEIAAKHGLRVMRGQMVVELIAGEQTKGDALEAFMRQAPFFGRRATSPTKTPSPAPPSSAASVFLSATGATAPLRSASMIPQVSPLGCKRALTDLPDELSRSRSLADRQLRRQRAH